MNLITISIEEVLKDLGMANPFEIAGAENGTKTNIRNALKHCASKPNVKIAVLFFPNNNFDAKELNDGLAMYCGLDGTAQFKEFELIFCIQGNKIIHIKKPSSKAWLE